MSQNQLLRESPRAKNQGYGESVLFAFVKKGQILCEWRDRFGVTQYSIPGGKIEPRDREHSNYQENALNRETQEEFQVIPTQFQQIGEIWYKNEWLFHVYIVSEWQGKIPTRVIDSQRPLNWIRPADLVDNLYMPGISALIQEHLKKND